MTQNTPLSPRPLRHLSSLVQRRVMTARRLRDHGVPASTAEERCRPGGPWQMLLPGVYLLHPGRPTTEERLQAVLLYAGQPHGSGGRAPGASAGPNGGPSADPGTSPGAGTEAGASPGTGTGTGRSESGQGHGPGPQRRPGHRQGGEADPPVITGLAALALHGFSSAPALFSLRRIDVLVPHTRRLRSTGFARVVHAPSVPRPQEVGGFPVAPVPRALADAAGASAVTGQTDTTTIRRLFSEAVRDGHCEAHDVVREVRQSRLLSSRPEVAEAIDALLAEDRALAESCLYGIVRTHSLPEPCWNVDLHLPGALHLGSVDAYWPQQGVAVEIDTRLPGQDDDVTWSQCAHKRESLEHLGIALIHITPAKLRDSPTLQATVLRTALLAAAHSEPMAYVQVLPR